MESFLRELDAPRKMTTYSKISKFQSKMILDYDFDCDNSSIRGSFENNYFNIKVRNRCLSCEVKKSENINNIYKYQKELVPRARYKSLILVQNNDKNKLKPDFNYERNKKTKISKFSKISKCSDLSNINKPSRKSSFGSSIKNQESEMIKSEYESVSVLFKNDITIVKEECYEHNIFKSNSM